MSPQTRPSARPSATASPSSPKETPRSPRRRSAATCSAELSGVTKRPGRFWVIRPTAWYITAGGRPAHRVTKYPLRLPWVLMAPPPAAVPGAATAAGMTPVVLVIGPQRITATVPPEANGRQRAMALRQGKGYRVPSFRSSTACSRSAAASRDRYTLSLRRQRDTDERCFWHLRLVGLGVRPAVTERDGLAVGHRLPAHRGRRRH
jgi:hypothetical protein